MLSGPAASMQSSPSFRQAWLEWWEGTSNVRAWWTLASYDIVLRYRRSILGPLWLTISMGAMLLGIGPLYT